MRLQTNSIRSGFTLVELMVAAAISVIIMTILSTVFQIAMDAMRQVRSAANMADQLRAVSGVVQKDLGRNGGTFFMPDENNPSNNGVKLSDLAGSPPPSGGYMAIVSPASQFDGIDNNGFASTIANPTLSGGNGHVLRFTSVLPGLLEKDNYTANVNNQTFTSPAAEIAYFLVPSPNGLLPNGNPLFNLHRRQWLVAKTTVDVNRLAGALALNPVAAPTVISAPNGINVNTMQSVSSNRSPAGPIGTGEDILLSNVISFEIKINGQVTSTGLPLSRPFGVPTLSTFDNNPVSSNSDFPFDTLFNLPGASFDTSTAFPNPIIVRTLQIRIRIYDPKLQNSRQMTIVQDL